MRSDAPANGDMGCVLPKKGKKVTNGDDQSSEVEMDGNKGVCTINNE